MFVPCTGMKFHRGVWFVLPTAPKYYTVTILSGFCVGGSVLPSHLLGCAFSNVSVVERLSLSHGWKRRRKFLRRQPEVQVLLSVFFLRNRSRLGSGERGRPGVREGGSKSTKGALKNLDVVVSDNRLQQRAFIAPPPKDQARELK